MSALLGDQRLANPPVERSLSKTKSKEEPEKPNSSLTKFQIVRKYFGLVYKKLRLKYFIPLLLVALYGFIGAGLFMATERSNDRLVKEQKSTEIIQARRALARTVARLHKNSSFTSADRLQRMNELFIQYEEQIGFSFKSEPGWGFWESTYYAVTIYTTIGYGNVYPATTAGQVLTVFYAILGIPLVLTALNELGKFLFLLILDLYIILSNKSKCSKSANAPSKSEVGKTGDPVIEITTHHFVQDEMIEIDPLDEELLEEKVKSIPVWVALTVTIGWIFLCAGIFLIFEHDWTFWESTYFIFISLSTIGLGDLTPSNPAYMVAVMLLVIVGLSLVSMSIGVIQNRLEELYIQLLMMILTEYQKRISQGLGESDATVGMMDTWANNKTAKFLLPLLSNAKMQNAVEKFTKQAEAKGIPIPPSLRKFDSTAGVPAIFKLDRSENSEELRMKISNAIGDTNPMQISQISVRSQQPEMAMWKSLSYDPSIKVATYEAEAQTDILFSLTETTQTQSVAKEENFMQTTSSCFGLKSETTQTHIVMTWNNDSQTTIVYFTEEESQTTTGTLSETETQTASTKTVENFSQCQNLELSDFGQQAEEIKNQMQRSMQTLVVDLIPATMQTSLHETVPTAMQTSMSEVLPKSMQTSMVEASPTAMQTSMIETLPTAMQTSLVETLPTAMQTSTEEKPSLFEAFMQTSMNENLPKSMQTSMNEQITGSMQTSMIDILPRSMQTSMEEKPILQEALMQTSVIEQWPKSMQTSITESDPKSMQTSMLEMIPKSIQTSTEELPQSSKVLLSQTSKQESMVSSLGSGEEFSVESVDKGEGSEDLVESESDLEWDPIDGMHAEKQQKVGSLKKMYEANKVQPKVDEKAKKKLQRKSHSIAK